VIAKYRNEEYSETGIENENVIVRINNRLETIKAERISVVDDAANQKLAVVAEMDDLLVYLKSNETRSLIVEADIEVSADLSDRFLVIVSGSSNDVGNVIRSLPYQLANQSSKVSFTIKTSNLTNVEHYRFAFLPKENRTDMFPDPFRQACVSKNPQRSER